MVRWLTKAGCQLGFGFDHFGRNCARREIVTLPFCAFPIYFHADHKVLLFYLDVRIFNTRYVGATGSGGATSWGPFCRLSHGQTQATNNT